MSYYPTLTEDIERAKVILEKGRAEIARGDQWLAPGVSEALLKSNGGTIWGADIYAAYKLLESFVEAIEAVGPKVCELAVRAEKRREARR